MATLAPATHPAEPILATLGGLRVGRTGPGENCARSEIAFFLVLPESGDHDIHRWECLLETTLVGVGEVDHSHGELWVAADGRCFGRSLVHHAFYFEGAEIAEAIENLTRGRRARPLIPPNAESVMLYGDRYTREHPDAYGYGRPMR